MTEERNSLNKLVVACWKDDALKERFMTDPKAILAEYGMDVPENLMVKIVENTSDTVHITIPQAPENHQELSDVELASAAGGAAFGEQSVAGPCGPSQCAHPTVTCACNL